MEPNHMGNPQPPDSIQMGPTLATAGVEATTTIDGDTPTPALQSKTKDCGAGLVF